MKVFIRKIELQTMRAYVNVKARTHEIVGETKKVLLNSEGQGTLDVAVTVLISIVLGALILGGLYLIVSGTILPTITQKIKDMFNYQG